jgi:protein-S-isoprenylcysteine O-methyltransferase Ste14
VTGATLVFIGACWGFWVVYWVVLAFSAKRTVEHGGFFQYRVVAGATFLILVAAARLLHVSAQSRLWHTTFALGLLTDCVVVLGLAIEIWARNTLGRNWSAEVTFKEGHELIESGPYAFVRHPIYTGLLLMGIATAANYGRAIGFGLVIVLCAAFWWKLRQEERIMSAHFPAYADYKKRVHAIIPFVL